MSALRARPNVLFILADDHQSNAIGALGHPCLRTPALDSLVDRGTTFTHAYNMGSLIPAVCSPSRACLLTGRQLFQSTDQPGLGNSAADYVCINPATPTLPERFQAAGYETFISGKWHNDVETLKRSFESGSRIFQGGMCDHNQVPLNRLQDFSTDTPPRIEEGFSTDLFCQSVATFLTDRTQERPFFAWLSLTSPHDPRTPPAEFAEMYDPADIPLPDNFLEGHPFDNGELDIRDEKLLPKPLDPDELRRDLANYYGMISHHDAAIGRILDHLTQLGIIDETIIVYLSDHGLALGQHGLLGKQNLYEHSIRVPLLMAGPGVPRNQRNDGLAYSFDIHRTLCDLIGIPVTEEIESRNLLPSPRGASNAPGRDSIFSLYKDIQRTVTDGRWKLIVYQVADQTRYQLFDLKADPGERCDLSDDQRHTRPFLHLLARLNQWQKETGDLWNIPALAEG